MRLKRRMRKRVSGAHWDDGWEEGGGVDAEMNEYSGGNDAKDS